MMIFFLILAGVSISLGFVAMNAVTIRQSKPLPALMMFAGALIPAASLAGNIDPAVTVVVGVAVWAFGTHLYFPKLA